MVCKKGCCVPLIIILIIGVVNLTYYHLYLKLACTNPTQCDFMNKNAFKVGNTNFSWWPISHFIMYLCLGFLFPNCWPILFLIGIAWEGIEFIGGLLETKKAKKGNVQYSQKWWAPNVADLILNILGLAMGVAFAKSIQTYKEKKAKEEFKKRKQGVS